MRFALGLLIGVIVGAGAIVVKFWRDYFRYFWSL
jgi:hypothetical protein